jgi:cell division protein FtsL
MRFLNFLELFFALVLGAVLFVMSLMLVNKQYEMRTLFVEHERAVDVGRRLGDDQADLLLKVRRASLPGSIAQGAAALGLVQAGNDNTINLVVDSSKRVEIAPDTAAAIREARESAEAEAKAKENEKAKAEDAKPAAREEGR